MTERRSGRLGAIVATALSTLAFGGVAAYGYVHWSGYQRQHADERKEAAEGQASQVGREASAKCKIVPGVETFECVIDADDAERPNKAAEYDLKAQQEMAEWAYSLVWVGILGLITSVGGIGLVYLNLIALNRQTQSAREIGEAQLRPFPMISNDSKITLRFRPDRETFSAKLVLRVINGGATPIFNVRCRFDVYVWQAAKAWPAPANWLFAFSEEFAHLAPKAPPAVVSYQDKWAMHVSKWRETVAQRSFDGAVYDASIAVHCLIEADNYAGRPVPTYAVWLEMDGDAIPESISFAVDPPKEVVVRRGFHPPRRDFVRDRHPRDPPDDRFPPLTFVDPTEDKEPPLWRRIMWKLRKPQRAQPRR